MPQRVETHLAHDLGRVGGRPDERAPHGEDADERRSGDCAVRRDARATDAAHERGHRKPADDQEGRVGLCDETAILEHVQTEALEQRGTGEDGGDAPRAGPEDRRGGQHRRERDPRRPCERLDPPGRCTDDERKWRPRRPQRERDRRHQDREETRAPRDRAREDRSADRAGREQSRLGSRAHRFPRLDRSVPAHSHSIVAGGFDEMS